MITCTCSFFLSGGLVGAGQLTTFRCDFVLIQVDQVNYSQLVTHGDGVSVTVRLLSNLH